MMIKKRHILEIERMIKSESLPKSGQDMVRRLNIDLDEVALLTESFDEALIWAKNDVDVPLDKFIDSIRCAEEL